MQHLNELILQYGNLFYAITFVWTALEGETFVILAGFAAQKGLLNIYLLFLAAWTGSMVGDQIFFFIGRRYGARILAKTPRLKPKVERAMGWISRYAVAYILIYRFLYGIRNISGIALGLSPVPWRKFALWNVVAAGLWSASFCGFGYMAGKLIKGMGRNKEEALTTWLIHITLGILVVVGLLVAIRYLIIRIQRRMEEPDNMPEKSTKDQD